MSVLKERHHHEVSELRHKLEEAENVEPEVIVKVVEKVVEKVVSDHGESHHSEEVVGSEHESEESEDSKDLVGEFKSKIELLEHQLEEAHERDREELEKLRE